MMQSVANVNIDVAIFFDVPETESMEDYRLLTMPECLLTSSIS